MQDFTTDIKWMGKKLISGNIFLFIKELIKGIYNINF